MLNDEPGSANWGVLKTEISNSEGAEEVREKSTVFPHIEDYESDSTIGERRKILLQIIKMLDEAGREVDEADQRGLLLRDTSHEDRISKLQGLVEQLKSLNITEEYLEQFMQVDTKLFHGTKHFNETARKSPDIMTKWIAHELISIVHKLSEVKDNIGFISAIGALVFFKNVLDAD